MSDHAASSLTSIIVVSYHTGDCLFRTIDDALAQTLPVELIVVDNGNPAATQQRLQAQAAADPRLKIIAGHGNIGFSRANNKAVAASRGAYLLILNPDCELKSDALARLYRHDAYLRHSFAQPPPLMIGARILNKDGTDQRGCRRELLTPLTAFVEALKLARLFPRLRLNKHEEKVPEILTPMPAISGAFMFLSRADYDRIGGFDEGYFLHVEDLDFCFRFRKAGGEIYFAPDIVVTHGFGTSLSSFNFIEFNKAKGFIRYFHRNFRDSYPLIFLSILDIAIGARYLLRRQWRRPAS